MKHPAGRLLVYESLYALNRDFEQVLAHFARLQELGVFQQRDFGNIFRVIVQETRAWANLELVQALQPREQDAWTRFGRLHNDLLIEAKLLQKKRRKAAGKKLRQKRGGAETEGV